MCEDHGSPMANQGRHREKLWIEIGEDAMDLRSHSQNLGNLMARTNLSTATEAMKNAPTTTLGVLVGKAPLHMTPKAGEVKAWSRIGSNTARRYTKKRITPLHKLEAVGINNTK